MARRGGGGVPGHKGGNDRTLAVNAKRSQEQRNAWRERLDVGQIMRWLEDVRTGKIKDANPMRIKTAEMELDRLTPRLLATELTEVNELDSLSREEVLGRIRALIAADPTLLGELVAMNAKEAAAAPVVVVEPKKATH